ncbi:helix-turn-helix domain-containing protein [Pseudoalteromonas sp. MMG022]|uniref:helix-turn-helix domain-containing protein n=1 Tax=Pseudoalteromonas sp. MMG022 TaxID=2909978 RepID=UPI001F2E1A88|nr:helix-turn-helix domain-containing protein [Pseudoalteromonas sp. MMG022]MCF6437221.1 helix-turn-helix domain-containing protein [Pseudoalteromonas sp. MMG022]
MILKQLRISRRLSQEQLAEMSGLSVRTIQRIESGANASIESQKCIAAALDVSIDTLHQETIMFDKNSENWNSLPLFMKIWFTFNFLQLRPKRNTAKRIEIISHVFGFAFCLLGLVNEAALVGGLIMLMTAYLFTLLKWQGDKFGIWYEEITNKDNKS